MTLSSAPTLRLGAAWYPELWDEKTGQEDVRLMARLGLNVVRLVEFSWFRLEPREGVFETSWLREILDRLQAVGIGAVLGTPTAAPPLWLSKKYPNLGYVEPNGYRHRHGARQHACYNHEGFRQHAARITETLAREFGSHPAVVTWQIDNEFRGHQKLCICSSCQSLWAQWLEGKYGSIERLNDIWGTGVWSHHYDSLHDVPQPYVASCWSHHWSLLINYRRFMSDSVMEFLAQQAAVVRQHSQRPLTHNSENSVDEWSLFRDLDFASADIYAGFYSLPEARLRLDSLRALKPGRRFWVMETGSDDLSQTTEPGWLESFTFQHYASGAESVLFWPWRQMRTGSELQTGAVVAGTGQPSLAWSEVEKVSTLRGKLTPILREYSPAPAEVALVRSEVNGHYFFSDRVAGLEPEFSYRQRFSEEYQSLVEAGAWLDVPFDESPLDRYRVIFSPYLPYASAAFLEKMRAHLERGGAWVVGPYCGYREQDNTAHTTALLGELEKMLGFKTRYFLASDSGMTVSLSDGTKSRALFHLTVFEPGEGDEVLGVYNHPRLAGQAWGFTRKQGPGRIYVLGSALEAEARTRLYREILRRENISTLPTAPDLWICPQTNQAGGTAWAVSNFSHTTQALALPAPGRDLLTNTALDREVSLPPRTNAFFAF